MAVIAWIDYLLWRTELASWHQLVPLIRMLIAKSGKNPDGWSPGTLAKYNSGQHWPHPTSTRNGSFDLVALLDQHVPGSRFYLDGGLWYPIHPGERDPRIISMLMTQLDNLDRGRLMRFDAERGRLLRAYEGTPTDLKEFCRDHIQSFFTLLLLFKETDSFSLPQQRENAQAAIREMFPFLLKHPPFRRIGHNLVDFVDKRLLPAPKPKPRLFELSDTIWLDALIGGGQDVYNLG
jgi:hypothetical protein